jgi:hypothetical protein
MSDVGEIFLANQCLTEDYLPGLGPLGMASCRHGGANGRVGGESPWAAL